MELLDNPAGNYRFLTGGFPYSSGVVSVPGYEIAHATLHQPIPYKDGFNLIDRHLRKQDRPRTALCGIELRSPEPYSFEGFGEFNEGYVSILSDWGLHVDGYNPIARTNVAPLVSPPEEPSLYGFSYTIESPDGVGPTFVASGAGDLTDNNQVIRPEETSADAMQEKANFVMGIMSERVMAMQVSWADVTAIDIYTVQILQPYLASAILEQSGLAAAHGIRWFYSYPPISGLEFEMDIRGVQKEVRVWSG